MPPTDLTSAQALATGRCRTGGLDQQERRYEGRGRAARSAPVCALEAH